MWASQAEAAREQERRLRELLRIAVSAPYWRRVIEQAGVAPEQFTLSDLTRLPFLTKDLLREKEQEMRVPAARGVYANYSGGSTGVPIRFYQNLD